MLHNIDYTQNMRTAVYIPDDIFNLAEKIARHMKITRSEFYSRAIKDYLESVEDGHITQKLNSVYEDKNNPSKIDRRINRAQLNILEKEVLEGNSIKLPQRILNKFKGKKLELLETDDGILIKTGNDIIKEARGILKGCRFNTATYLEQKERDKELEK
ncbi:MAG: hypothetical protein ACM3SY_00800 [Candidatus Omnitrophota bacterium]